MRISREFATALADRLAARAMKLEQADIEAKRMATVPRLLSYVYGGKPESFYEKLPSTWTRKFSQTYFHVRDGRDYVQFQVKFDREHILPFGAQSGVCIDNVDADFFAEIKEIERRWHNMHRREYELRAELKRNAVAARTVKNLLLLWPEAAEDIAKVVDQFGHTSVEVPLENILRRHAPLMIASPIEVEVVA